MASLEDGLRGNKKENYVGDSDPEIQEGDEVPARVKVPVSDGLPQVRKLRGRVVGGGQGRRDGGGGMGEGVRGREWERTGKIALLHVVGSSCFIIL